MVRITAIHRGDIVCDADYLQCTDADAVWVHIANPNEEEVRHLREHFHLDVSQRFEGVREDDVYTYIPTRLITLAEDDARPVLRTVVLALGERVVATIDDHSGSPAFEKARRRILRKPKLGENPRTILRVVLQCLNEAGEQLIDRIGDDLAVTGAEIIAISGSLRFKGKDVGIIDLTALISQLHIKEELISQCLERQLFLARAARRLDSEIDNLAEPELAILLDELIADINGVKEHASYEHEKVRYLQEAVNASLNIKQNQIVKIFTIIAAVFMPPTLVASVYGMNWAVMPELAWTHGFFASITVMTLSALLPLVYIKRRRWLR